MFVDGLRLVGITQTSYLRLGRRPRRQRLRCSLEIRQNIFPLLASLLFLFLFFSCLLAILDQWHATLPSARVPCIIMIGKEFSGSEIVLDDPIDQIPSVWESEREE